MTAPGGHVAGRTTVFTHIFPLVRSVVWTPLGAHLPTVVCAYAYTDAGVLARPPTHTRTQEKANERYSKGLVCPLDEIDAASRVLDLMYVGSEEFGKFWKDYREIPW